MLQKRLMIVLGLVIALSMVLTACGPSATPTAAPVSQATAAPRHGGWLDEIDVSVVSQDSVLSQLQAGAINAYTFGLSSAQLSALKSSGLSYEPFYGASYSLILNPAKLKDANSLNPFSDAKIREALNWLIDRNYINQEVYGGGSLPKYTPLTTQLVEYTGLVDIARGIESQYAYNPDKAKQVISAEMTTLGATQDSNGKWQFKGKPVTLIFLIRSDGDGTRKPMGDYVANQLETVGFTVDRQYKKSSEAAPIWQQSDPAEGQWELYTNQWGAPGLTRDERNQFQQMYAPDSQQSLPLFLANTGIDPTFQKLADNLANGNYSTLQQRHDMMAQALPLALKDSLQVWLIDGLSYAVQQKNVVVTNDVGAGVESSDMNPFNMRFADKAGGTLKIGTNDLFTGPWNTISNGNWGWDSAIMKDTSSGSAISAQGGIVGDPFTGLAWPQRIATAEVTVQTGLPVSKTLDWLSLKTADKISVPPDAWVDWDAKAQKFITAADALKAQTASDQVNAKAQELAGAVNLKSIVPTPASQPVPAAAATPSATATPAPLSAGAQPLVKLVTDLAAFYTQTTGVSVDVTSALASEDTKTSFEAEAAKVSALTSDADKQKELASFAVSFVGGMDTSGYYTRGTIDYSTAKIKSVVTYPPDLFQKVKWHDGSPLSVADFIMPTIEFYDRANPASKIYDESAVPYFQSFQPTFKGFRITSTNPLTIESYSDLYNGDAELDVVTGWPTSPNGLQGENSWDVLAISNMAEADGQLAYSPDKADANKIDQTSWVGGPSLAILSKELDQASSQTLIPYAPMMSQYITADEAKARYNNLKKWYTAHGTFWIGTGPYYLDKVFTTEKTLVLKNNPDFPDLSDQWASFSQPKLANTQMDGPSQVKVGTQATFDVNVTYNGNPYAKSDIKQVKYLLYDANNAVIASGAANAVAEGHYQAVLGSDVTSKLSAGSYKLEVAVVPIPVAIPSFSSTDFVVVP
jgi:hypothetical protein